MSITGTCFHEQVETASLDADVLRALSNVIDPDFGEDIVKCGFVKKLDIDAAAGHVAFTLELTTPACPVKEMFQRQATEFVKVSQHVLSQQLLSQYSYMFYGTKNEGMFIVFDASRLLTVQCVNQEIKFAHCWWWRWWYAKSAARLEQQNGGGGGDGDMQGLL